MRLEPRPVDPATVARLREQGVHPVLARVFAGRGIGSAAAIGHGLEELIPPATLAGVTEAVDLLVHAIRERQAICVIADYDCDGATACAVAMRGLAGMGARIDYLVPNRLIHGYGLTPEIVALALEHPRLGRPDLLVTVDNGIASHEGIAAANAAGLQVLVTDHHLPADTLPPAAAIVNPNQPGCHFPSKHLAGVGVIFYLLAALRARWRDIEPGHPAAAYPVAQLLDLVALGTVADLVRLDENNRRLVAAGLRTIRSGRGSPGIRALLTESGRDWRAASTTDLGFTVGPRINAAGRLADITLGISCLLSADEDEAHRLGQALDKINRERRDIETTMHEQAIASLDALPAERCSVSLHHPEWHEGVVGLVASRLKTRYGRPAFAFASSAADPAMAKGSGRSIPGIHLRDTLDLIVKQAPGLITRFGGHAMAAGLSLPIAHLARFAELLEAVIARHVDPTLFSAHMPTDGVLDPALIDLPLVEQIEAQVWGQGFPAPVFEHEFQVLRQRLVGESHLKLELGIGRRRFEAIAFRRSEPLPATTVLAYRPAVNEYRGLRSVQLIIEAAIGD